MIYEKLELTVTRMDAYMGGSVERFWVSGGRFSADGHINTYICGIKVATRPVRVISPGPVEGQRNDIEFYVDGERVGGKLYKWLFMIRHDSWIRLNHKINLNQGTSVFKVKHVGSHRMP